MNDDFTPANVQPQTMTPDIQAATEFAKVAGDRRLVQLIQQSAQLHQFKQFKIIENQEQYDQAIDAFDAAKKVIKELEDLRHSVVDYPTKFVKMVNDLFKQIRDGAEGSKAHLAGILAAKKQKDIDEAEAAEKARLESEKENEREKGEVVEDHDGVGVVQMDGEGTPPPPNNVVESARGAKVHSRKETVVEVEDLKLFLKTLASANKRYEWFTSQAEDLVEVKVGVLKKLVKGAGKKKIPGIKVSTVSRVV